MSLLTEKDERFKNLYSKVVIFLLLALVGVGLVFLWTGIKKGIFTPMSPVFFVADSGQDLNEGMPVKFSGFKIGKLQELSLDAQGHVQVEVRIDTRYLELMRQDAQMMLKKEGMIGDGVLEISRGTESLPPLAAGGKISFGRSNNLEQALVDVKNRVLPILDDVHVTLSDPKGDLRRTLKNLNEFSAGLNTTKTRIDHTLGEVDEVLGGVGQVLGSADQMMASVDGSINNEVNPLLRSLRNTANSAERLSVRIEKDVPVLLKSADSSMESLRQTSESIKNAVQQTAPQLPAVLGETRDTLSKTRILLGDSQEMVESLSTRWPFNGTLPPVETGPIGMDSHD
ncbi:MAG: MlaD family protein [Gallionellaceae bacterium]|jgi:phospholipid/cholesterol/gamma-HCH transport system substrate-binding protein